MRLIALEIPDDAADLPGWLEGHLVGLDLSALVAELEAVHGSGRGLTEPPVSIETVLGSQREAVLADGLATLPHDRLRQLLRHPRLLLDLQDLVLSSGGPYWDRLAETSLEQAPGSEHRAAVDRGWAWLTANVIDQPATPEAISIDVIRAEPARRRWRPRMLLAVAAAAVVLAAVTFYGWPGREQNGNGPGGGGKVASAGWGWSRADALPQDLPRDAYLNHLADGAQAWFKNRPTERAALNQRLTEFRQGCSALIESPHKPLSEGDRLWLVAKCRDWSATVGRLVVALQSRGEDVIRVRNEADETINRLISALRERARGTA
jgi:hypothetical protein